MSFRLDVKVAECLKSQREEKKTAREIAEWILRYYPDECAKKIKRSKNKLKADISSDIEMNNLLVEILVAEIGSKRALLQRKTPQIKTTEGRPRKYYYTEQTDDNAVAVAEGEADLTKDSAKYTEHDLYPILKEFLFSENENIYSMRIDEKRSSNMKGVNGNRWLYPDMVALEDLSADWVQEVRDCVQQIGDLKAVLWSFEVKLLVNRSNVREVFFQTVSNSSWAEYGYLVAAQIEGNETMKELRILSALHGIGVIQLNVENPAESQIIIPAERRDVDWNTANRLARENKDFREFLQLVTEFHQTGKTRQALWAC